jgi:hypothetical protein
VYIYTHILYIYTYIYTHDICICTCTCICICKCICLYLYAYRDVSRNSTCRDLLAMYQPPEPFPGHRPEAVEKARDKHRTRAEMKKAWVGRSARCRDGSLP